MFYLCQNVQFHWRNTFQQLTVASYWLENVFSFFRCREIRSGNILELWRSRQYALLKSFLLLYIHQLTSLSDYCRDSSRNVTLLGPAFISRLANFTDWRPFEVTRFTVVRQHLAVWIKSSFWGSRAAWSNICVCLSFFPLFPFYVGTQSIWPL